MTPEQAFGKVLKEIRPKDSLSKEKVGFENGYNRTLLRLFEKDNKSSPCINFFVRDYRWRLSAQLQTICRQIR